MTIIERTKSRKLLSAGLLLAVVVLVQSLSLRHVQGATFTVTNTNDSGAGSLRQAILDANATTTRDTISFNIPGSGVKTIKPLTFLPSISQPVIIDGTTQPGWSAGNPLIEIDGEMAGANVPGLIFVDIPISAPTSTVRGLIVNRFDLVGIKLLDSSNITITGCFIGTDATGTVARPNFDGIILQANQITDADHNIIGGTTLAERNIITGNIGYGIALLNADDNFIVGNYVGTDKTGMVKVGAQDGMILSGSSNTVGGPTAGQGNLISGSSTDGIILAGAFNQVLGNLIGTAADGVAPLPNGRDGIRIDCDGFSGQNNNTIGGTVSTARNVIAFNKGRGVNLLNRTQASNGHRIVGNLIYSNGSLGIDLNDDGVTPNDGSDPDTGVNDLQNFPVLTSATTDGSLTTIVGSLDSTPSTQFRIEFFANSRCHSSGNGQGEIFLNATTITTNSLGHASFNVSFGQTVSYGQFVTATATRNAAPLSTSEFSACVPVSLSTFVVTTAADSGAGSLRQAILNSNASSNLNLISFNIPGSGVHTITPASALPNVTNRVIIDGLTQPGATCEAPLIELNGTNAGGGIDGLLISAGNSFVQGLVINRFNGDGISLITNGGNTARCNRIGVDVTGNVDLGNGANGILISSSSNNTITNNTISGNSLSGIRFVTTSNNVVQGNVIGLSTDGLARIGNSGGIAFFSSGTSNLVGGTTEESRNIISGNNGSGILLRDSGVTNNSIQGNYIGVNQTGSGAGFGNTADGIQIALSSSFNTIGGSGAGNTIAFNFNRGVSLVSTAGTGNMISRNSIHSNGTPTNFLGIDINADGVTPNDNLDADTGPNDVQNFPAITAAQSFIAGTVITGTLHARFNASFRIELFANAACDALGNGEGEQFLTSVDVDTDAAGNASFSVQIDQSLPIGAAVTATATRTAAPFDTSEFSPCVAVTALAPASVVVTNTNNSGSGSLRQAIIDANANADITLISFNIPGAGVHTISPTSALPQITKTTIVDGLTQPGASCATPLIELDGTNAGDGADGLNISAGNCGVQGLIINRFGGDGVELNTTGNDVIKCSFIGTSANGLSPQANGANGVFVSNTSNNTIGGAGSGNVISGNAGNGVLIENGDQNLVQGNTIGLTSAGGSSAGNVLNGVYVLNSNDCLVGGATSALRNVISGNTATGILIESNGGSSSVGNEVQGNFIGVNLAGNAAAGTGNQQDGIRISGSQTINTLIGGATAGAGNVISNNGPHGIRSQGSPADLLIKGNLIGTNAAGTADAGNNDTGIAVSGTGIVIGGTTAAERNVISGNTRGINIGGTLTTGTIQGNFVGLAINGTGTVGNVDGVIVSNVVQCLVGGTTPGAGNVISSNGTGLTIVGSNCTVQGNLIGTDVTGTLDKGNGTGISLDGTDNLIGGSTAAARNLISGNGSGIRIQDVAPANPVGNNSIKNNFIGTNAAGSAALPNSLVGIFIDADNNVIGGTAGEGAGNVIAFNTQGVVVAGHTGNRITCNSIYSNGSSASQLGIDLNGDGVTANDNLDGDTGPNNKQNYPVINSATTVPNTSVTIQGTLNSTPNSTFQLDFYSNPSCHISGFGQGQNYIGFANVTTNGSGTASFNLTLPVVVPNGHRVTATATDAANNTSEFSGCSQPTTIELASFTATSYEGGVALEWHTGFEADNLGFNIHRDDNGKLEPVNQQLIGGSALLFGGGVQSQSGQSYQWWDPKPATTSTAYWLEDRDLNGSSRWHGPFYAIEAAGKNPPVIRQARLLAEFASSDATFTPVESRAELTTTKAMPRDIKAAGLTPAPDTVIKLGIKHEGWYKVSQPDLLAAGFNRSTDPRLLQLIADGKPEAITVNGEADGSLDPSDSIEFYGTAINSPFADSRTYYLAVGKQPGLRITQTRSSAYPQTGGSFPCTVERRERTIYIASLLNGERENFFGSVIASQPVSQSITIQHLDSSSSSNGLLRVALQGLTTVPHAVSVELNGSFVGQLNFVGQSSGDNSFSIPQSSLHDGLNVVRLTAQGGSSDVSLVSVIQLTYQHSFTADDNLLRLSASGRQPISIDGFTDAAIRVFDITDASSVKEIIGAIDSPDAPKGDTRVAATFRVTFTTPGDVTRTLLATTDSAARRPDTITRDNPSNIRGAVQAAELVILTPVEFRDQAQSLRAYRQAQGLTAAVVDIEDVYDEFSLGQRTPYAIRDFLAFANRTWRTRYVLIIGDASFDPKNYLGIGYGDLVPSKLIDTQFMETASDDWLADFDQNGIADLAIGRLPAQTRAEAQAMIEKIFVYEKAASAAEALLVSDLNEGFNFELANSQLIPLLPPVTATHLKRSALGDAGTRAATIEAINRGQKIVNYAGHGNANSWRGNILTSTDARALQNRGRPTVFVVLDCLNGYFQDPTSESLAEALMRNTNGGGVAAWASSAMTFPEGQATLDVEFYRQVFGNRARLGDAALAAKARISDIDVRRSWILFGDPSMRIK